MAILNMYLHVDKDYIQLINDIYKITTIFIVFQALLYFSNLPKNIIQTAFTGFFMNDDFMMLLIYVIISVSAYYLVFDKILHIVEG